MIGYSIFKKSDGSYSVKYKNGGEFFSIRSTNLTRTQATFLRDELNTAAKANRLASGYAK
jgi:hypothetical protein